MVWRYGPNGELGRGDADHQRAWRWIWWSAGIAVAISYFVKGTWVAAAVVFFCSISVAYKVSRYVGTPGYLEKFEGAAGTNFIILSVIFLILFKLLGVFFLQQDAAFFALVLIVAYIWFVNAQFSPENLWKIGDTITVGPSNEVDWKSLSAMASTLLGHASKLRDAADPLAECRDKLAKAHEAKNLEEITRTLDGLNAHSKTAMTEAVICLNRGIQFREIANRTLRVQVAQANVKLQKLPIAKTSELKLNAAHLNPLKEKFAHAEMGRIIPPRLSENGLARYNAGVGTSLGRVGAEAILGRMPPLIALAAGAVVLIADQANKSRMLRQYKDLEGEVFQTWENTVGDRNNIVALIETRYVPDIDLIADICGQLNSHSPEDLGGDSAKLTHYLIAVSQGELLLERAKG